MSGTDQKERHEQRLKSGSLGAVGIIFFVAAAAGPLAATLGASPIAFASNGVGAPGAYALSSIILLIFAVGYAAMSNHITSAGGFPVYISRGFGRTIGIAAAFVAVFAYNCMLLGLYGLFAYFSHSIIADKLGLNIPWPIWAFVGIVLVAVLGYNEVNLSVRVLGLLMILEVVILLVFDVTVIAKGGQSGISGAAFSPSNIFHGTAGIAILFAMASFVGFEATAVYGEEARTPKRTIPRATYGAVLLLGGFYTLSTWAIGLAYGPSQIAKAATNNPGSLVFDANTRYVGAVSTDIMYVLLITSMFAVVLSFHNTLARYLYSLGRNGVLPAVLGRTHRRHQAPHIASAVQSGIAIVIVGVFAAAQADPFAQLYSWLVAVGTVGVLVLQGGCSAAVFAFFRRTKVDRRPWHTMAAPVLGTLGLGMAVYLSVTNFDQLTGVASGPISLLPWLLVVAAIGGIAVARLRLGPAADYYAGVERTPAIQDPSTADATDEEADPMPQDKTHNPRLATTAEARDDQNSKSGEQR